MTLPDARSVIQSLPTLITWGSLFDALEVLAMNGELRKFACTLCRKNGIPCLRLDWEIRGRIGCGGDESLSGCGE